MDTLKTNSVTMKMEALHFSETSEHLNTTQCRNPKNTICEGRSGHSTPGVSYGEKKPHDSSVTQRAGGLARELPLDFNPPAAAAPLYFPH